MSALPTCLPLLAALALPAGPRAEAPPNALLDAVIAGDSAAVRKLLASGADPDRRRVPPNVVPRPRPEDLFRHRTEGEWMVLRAREHLDAHTETPLHAAVWLGKRDIVRLLLRAGADAKARLSTGGATPLHHAAVLGDPEVVFMLVAHGADLEARDDAEATPLHHAAQRPGVMLRLLLDAGADVNARDKLGMTALRRLIEQDPHPREVAGWLIERGADINLADHAGKTPLHAAIQRHQPELARRLLEAGARVNTAGPGGLTPLHAALGRADLALARLLLAAGAKVGTRDATGAALIHYAVTLDSPAAARLLLEHGADPNSKNKSGDTPLHLAAGNRSPTDRGEELLLALLAHKADPHAKNDAGKTPFDAAVAAFYYNAARILGERMIPPRAADAVRVLSKTHWHLTQYLEVKKELDAGGDPNARDQHGNPRVVGAALAGNLPLVELLLARKADVNALGKDRQTALGATVSRGAWLATRALLKAKADPNEGQPLIEAVGKGHVETARLLLKNGARLDAWRHVDHIRIMGPLLLAVDRGDLAMVDLLLEHGADVNDRERYFRTPALVHALESKHRHVFDRLLRHKDIDIKAASQQGQTALHLAAGAGDVKLVTLLLDRGADVNALERRHYTPLHWAIGSKHLPTVRLLLDRGADPAAQGKDEQGLTGEAPLHAAVRVPGVMPLLLKKGVPVNPRDQRGRTPLHLAAEWADGADAAQTLLDAGADPSAADRDRLTPLHQAALIGNERTARLLLARKADANARDGSGHTPLLFACAANQVGVAAILLERGADPNAAILGSKETPLHRAATQANRLLVELLLEYRADSRARDSRDQTPLDLARRSGHREIVTLLERRPREKGKPAPAVDP